MVFIHPQFWREQYIGQKKDIEVDSNCESVELFVNGRSKGVRKPDAENFHVVKFENIQVEKGTVTIKGTKNHQSIGKELQITGTPARLKLTASHQKLTAATNSLAIVTADITDVHGITFMEPGIQSPGMLQDLRHSLVHPSLKQISTRTWRWMVHCTLICPSVMCSVRPGNLV